MYQFSRAIYRELSPEIIDVRVSPDEPSPHCAVLRRCEAAVERLAFDRHYFARPARTLFNDVRMYFPIGTQRRVWTVVARYMQAAEEWLATQPRQGCDIEGNPLQCRATTRRGTPASACRCPTTATAPRTSTSPRPRSSSRPFSAIAA